MCELSHNLPNDGSDLGKNKNKKIIEIGWFPIRKDTSATAVKGFAKAIVKVFCFSSIFGVKINNCG